MKKNLEKRLVYLYSGELAAAILFAFLSYLVQSNYPSLQLYFLISFWCSFLLLEMILLQGVYYWYAKLKRYRLEGNFNTSLKTVQILEKARIFNIVVFITALSAFIIDIYRWFSHLPISGLMWSGFILLFAVLEFINYFYRQLSYGNKADLQFLRKTKKLKQSCLNKDLDRLLR
ncbi:MULTISPECIES: general stress protein [Gracilibacillus]|uniref:general stress protein n=1 Tax=Gracilibacillus TaxID=74385 RepID=UPI0008244826|nr:MULTISPECIES: general stress protein [Gracilibacillus]